jgi:hypothetical protein
MKKVDEYIKDFWGEIKPDLTDSYNRFISVYDIKMIMRRIQEDAIRDTVKECSENAETYEYPYMDGCSNCGHTATLIDRQSILLLADKLIKEL